MRRVFFITSLALLLALIATTAFGALCVWLNPDRDIKKFFPGAKSYTTDIKKYSTEQGKAIEKRIGAKLDPDENEFKFYRVKKDNKQVGTVLTHQARGRYGAVQVVVGIGNDNKVIGVYVQRDREPTNLNVESFLKQFAGKTVEDPISIEKDIKPIKGHEKSSHAVAYSVKKILVVYDVLSK
jgi:Na+-translocating ferredoxin:NAD+ oxidoreductase RnfG subunit